MHLKDEAKATFNRPPHPTLQTLRQIVKDKIKLYFGHIADLPGIFSP